MKNVIDFFRIICRYLCRGIIPGSITIVYKKNGALMEYLIIKALPSRSVTFPGGTISWLENFEDTARRELYEETGIKTDQLTMLPFTHKFRYKNLPFKPRSEQQVFAYEFKGEGTKLMSKETEWFKWENASIVKKMLSHKELVLTFKKSLKFIEG